MFSEPLCFFSSLSVCVSGGWALSVCVSGGWALSVCVSGGWALSVCVSGGWALLSILIFFLLCHGAHGSNTNLNFFCV